MSSKNHNTEQLPEQDSMIAALNELAAAADADTGAAEAADAPPAEGAEHKPAEMPSAELPDAAASPAAQSAETGTEKKSGAKVVVPARLKVKTDRDGNLIETPPVSAVAPKKGRRNEPVRTVTPADIKKPQVSFMNSIANVEAEAKSQREAGATSQAYDHAVLVSEGEEDSSYRPKIRRMSDSTRAKELRRRQVADSQPYEKDTPVSTPQTLPASKLRKRREQPVSSEVLERIPENLKRHPLEQPKPVRYMKQAEHTHIDLSADSNSVRKKINIDVRYQDERRERTDLPLEAKPVNREADNEAIRNDLQELSTNQSLRILILGLLTLFSALLTILDWIPAVKVPSLLSASESPVGYLTVQLLLGLAALPFCFSLIKNGYLKLLQLRADCDSLAAMSMISAEIGAFLILPSTNMLRSGTVSVYISVGLLSLLMNAVGKKLIAVRAIRNFDRMTDGNPKYAIHYVEDERRAENLTRGTSGDFPILAAMQPIDEPEDFLKYTFSTDVADKFCRTAVPLVLILAALFSVGMSVMRADHVESAVCYGMSIFALCFSACACTAITLISNLPMASGTKDYVKNSGLLLGYQSVDDFFDINTVMVDASALFPRNTTKLENIQVIGESHIEEALQYAASLTQHGGSILKDLFSNAILAEEKMILPVEDYAYDEGKGISGWIQNRRVLLGTRDLMIEHSVEGIPPTGKVRSLTPNGSEALYLSISGSVAALFMIRLEAGRSVRKWLREMERENLFLIIRSNDAMLTQRRIAKMFNIREDHVKIIPPRLERDYAEETVPLEKGSPSMLCAGRLAGFIQTVIGAKRIRAASTVGILLQAVTACLGLLFAVLFIALGAYKDVSGAVLLLYHLICTVITVLSVRMKDT